MCRARAGQEEPGGRGAAGGRIRAAPGPWKPHCSCRGSNDSQNASVSASTIAFKFIHTGSKTNRKLQECSNPHFEHIAAPPFASVCPVLSGGSCWSSGARCLSPHTFREAINNSFWRGEYIPVTGRNSAAPHRGCCPTAALPFPCAPWTCQAGEEGHDRPATSFLIPQFPFSPYSSWVSGHVLVLLTVPVGNLRSRKDARQAREDSIPC